MRLHHRGIVDLQMMGVGRCKTSRRRVTQWTHVFLTNENNFTTISILPDLLLRIKPTALAIVVFGSHIGPPYPK